MNTLNTTICTSFFFGNSIKQYANMGEKNIDDHNEAYIKTAICLFSSIRYFSNSCKILFFINDLEKFNSIKDGYYARLLKEIKVDLICIKPNFVDESTKWAGSMFIFDVIDFLRKRKYKDKGYLFLDTDVVFLNDFDKVFNILEKYQWGGFAQFCEFRRLNCWIEDFHKVDLEKYNKNILPFGGEFLYLDANSIEHFFNEFIIQYKNEKGKAENIERLYTEEHYYSIIFNNSLFFNRNGLLVNPFFKRATIVNRCLDDQYLWGLHFPGEKSYKLKYLYNELKSNNFKFDPSTAKKILGVSSYFNYYDLKGIDKILKGIVKKLKKLTVRKMYKVR